MAAMLRLAAVLVAASLVGCAQVSPSDSGSGGSGGESGAGGAGGTGGTAGMDGGGGEGGTGGAGGSAGSGGTGGVTPDPCTPMITAFDNIEDDQAGATGSAEGSVSGACVMGECSGSDPFDRWRIEPACTGTHSITLTWENVARDLDLYLSDSGDQQIAQSANPSTTQESITAFLEEATFYIVEVQAFDTSATTTQYELSGVRN